MYRAGGLAIVPPLPTAVQADHVPSGVAVLPLLVSTTTPVPAGRVAVQAAVAPVAMPLAAPIVSRPSTGAIGEPGADAPESSCVPRTVTMPPETVTLGGPPPADVHEVLLQFELSAVPLKSSENDGASWTSPPESLVT